MHSFVKSRNETLQNLTKKRDKLKIGVIHVEKSKKEKHHSKLL